MIKSKQCAQAWLDQEVTKRREEHQCTQKKGAEREALEQAARKAQEQSNLLERICEEELVIRKVAPEPSGFASFDEDLEDEIDMTNLKNHVLSIYHPYLDIFSEC